MKCYHCASETKEKETNHITDFGECIVIIRRVPSYVCPNCGEVMYSAEVAKQLERCVNAAKSVMSELSVVDYQALSA